MATRPGALARPPIGSPSVIEILRFRLADGADEAAFLQADKRVQAEFAYQQPGLVRRTAARGDDGGWVVIDLWHSAAQAEAANAKWGRTR